MRNRVLAVMFAAGVGLVGDPPPPHPAAAATAAAPLVTTNSRLLGTDLPLPGVRPLRRAGTTRVEGNPTPCHRTSGRIG